MNAERTHEKMLSSTGEEGNTVTSFVVEALGFEFRDYTLAGQALYYLSHSTSPKSGKYR
jgi:hypothetical protein